jgi:hypothetical protein
MEQLVIDAIGEVDRVDEILPLSLEIEDILDHDRPTGTSIYIAATSDLQNATHLIFDIEYGIQCLVIRAFRERAREAMRGPNGIMAIAEEVRNRLIRGWRDGKFSIANKYELSPPDIGNIIYQVVDDSWVVGIVPFSSITTFTGGRVVASGAGSLFPVTPPPDVGDQWYLDTKSKPYRWHEIGEWFSEYHNEVPFMYFSTITEDQVIGWLGHAFNEYMSPFKLAITKVLMAQSVGDADPFNLNVEQWNGSSWDLVKQFAFDQEDMSEPVVIEWSGSNIWFLDKLKMTRVRASDIGGTAPAGFAMSLMVQEVGDDS